MRVVVKETKEIFEVEDCGNFYHITEEFKLINLKGEEVSNLKKDLCTPLIDRITSLDEYQKLAARTLPDLTEFYPDIEGQSNANSLHMWFGIDTEIGEILDLYKKSFAYRKKFDKVNLLEEICDIIWYLAGDATINNILLSEAFDDIVFEGNLIPSDDYPTLPIMDDVIDVCRGYNELKIKTEDFIGFFVSSEEELFKGLTNNINKLIVRYPDKFTNENAINRDLNIERKELEK